MKKPFVLAAFAALSLAGLSGAALAQTLATATADLNIRSGPGPNFASIGVIASGQTAEVEGCLEASKWCRVNAGGVSGWSYSDYLTAEASGQVVVLTEGYRDLGLATVTYEETGTVSGDTASGGAAGGAAAGTVGGAVTGALVGGPVGALVGGLVGAGTGAAAGAIVEPPETVRTYITANPAEPVYLEGEVVIGAGVPENVTLLPIPDYQYQYVFINGQPVLVDPGTRQIVYVVR